MGGGGGIANPLSLIGGGGGSSLFGSAATGEAAATQGLLGTGGFSGGEDRAAQTLYGAKDVHEAEFGGMPGLPSMGGGANPLSLIGGGGGSSLFGSAATGSAAATQGLLGTGGEFSLTGGSLGTWAMANPWTAGALGIGIGAYMLTGGFSGCEDRAAQTLYGAKDVHEAETENIFTGSFYALAA